MISVFTSASELPYELPHLDTITAEDLIDGVKEGIEAHAQEVAAIASDASPATFENTFVALELSGQVLARAVSTAFNIIPSHGTEEMKRAETTIEPLLNTHWNAILLSPELSARLSQVDLSGLSGEDARLAEQVLLERKLAGSELSDSAREELKELNARISKLTTAFGQAVSDDLNAAAVELTEDEAAGLSPAQLAATRVEKPGAAVGHEDTHRITLILPSSQPALAKLTHAESRRKLYESSVSRGSADDGGTLALAPQIAQLRAQRARLLGFQHHAEAVLAERSESDLSKVQALLSSAVDPALANAAREDAAIAAWQGTPVKPWDRARGLEALGADQGGVDESALVGYFELNRVIEDGVFRAAHLLYGLTFKARPDLPVHHPDARVWEVFDADGSGLGLFIGDYFARPTKRGGAWMNSLRDGASLVGQKPVVTNNLNIPKPAAGEPALVTLDEVNTLFHEFGHALHGLFSEAKYPSLAGTSVPQDIVEYPSQVNEMWAFHPEVLPHYAIHVETGEPLPADLVADLQKDTTWGEGFSTTEYLAASLLDLAWHQLAPDEVIEDPLAFEATVLADHGFHPDQLPPRYRTGYFQHIFDGGYSAGYYSYFWAEVLDADTVEWFKEQPSLREAGETFRRELLARGNTRDALESYNAFRGRAASTEPLLKRRGLI
ncbi:M3 family metallopeptidase [Galactobacter sp.]|uniref:M3 family metallopeptidase n=1 Tax=Galactobacter sp. TaxID=2676125 RepID=UPI0025BE6BCD|nr:M3 family metallopeptidase [Galactobacter sp.]